MRRFTIESSTDGVVWDTRDLCDTEPQYISGIASLEVFEHPVRLHYRVVDGMTNARTVVYQVDPEQEVSAA
jgi:hypothetical protein